MRQCFRMPLPESEKHNILRSFTIELERTFGVLSSRYGLDSYSEQFLTDLEAEVKAILKERQFIVTMLSPVVPPHHAPQLANHADSKWHS